MVTDASQDQPAGQLLLDLRPERAPVSAFELQRKKAQCPERASRKGIVFPLVAAWAGYGSVWRVNGKSVPAQSSTEDSAIAARPGARTGLLCGLAAYTAWGFIPLYFRAVSDVAPTVVLCH